MTFRVRNSGILSRFLNTMAVKFQLVFSMVILAKLYVAYSLTFRLEYYVFKDK